MEKEWHLTNKEDGILFCKYLEFRILDALYHMAKSMAKGWH